MLPLVAVAHAHQPGLSSIRLSASDLSMAFARPEIGMLAPVGDVDAGRVLIVEVTLAKLSLVSTGPCSFGEPSVRPVEGDGVEIVASYDCPKGEKLTITAPYLADLAPGHRQYVEASGIPVGLLSADAPSLTFAAVPSTGSVVREFVELGVEHIWTGYDHLAFLAGLLLTAPGLRDMLMVVTGFTVAHSITLSLAATGVFTLSPEYVEPAIAVSILYVGIENLLKPPFRRRVILTFLLGLIHGFGFAGLLAEIGIPQGNLAPALLAFNGGVELGQAAVAAITLPLLLGLRKLAAWDRYLMPGLSVCIALSGLWWLVQRTLLT